MSVKVEIFEQHEITKLTVIEEIRFTVGDTLYTVPKGFISDGMSITRLFWRILAPPVDRTNLKSLHCP